MRNTISAFLLCVGGACAADKGAAPACYPTTIDASRCDPASVTFTLASTNRYYPLSVGARVVLEGVDEDDQGNPVAVRVERTVLAETRMVDGVQTHVLEHKKFENGSIYEIARNFYVETTAGDACYFGEDVEFYQNGVLANTDGTWLAGAGGAKPGLIMPSMPRVGDAYYQENAPGVAEDMGRIVSINAQATIGGVTYQDVVEVMDVNPRDGCGSEEPKAYAPGVGEVRDVNLRAVSFTPALR